MGEDKSEMTCRAAGRMGGKKSVELAGREGMAARGRKGGAVTKERYGEEFYSEIGSKGGKVCRDKHGPDYYEKMGAKGVVRIRELVKKGKQVEEETRGE